MGQLTLFDYATLDQPTREAVIEHTNALHALTRRAATDIIEIGKRLTEVKARLPFGDFGAWLRAEFGWSHATATKFMRIYETFKLLDPSNLAIGSETLALLASPSTPESARAEVIERAEAGEPITFSTARAIVDDHKAPPEIEDPPEGFEDMEPDEEILDAQEVVLKYATDRQDALEFLATASERDALNAAVEVAGAPDVFVDGRRLWVDPVAEAPPELPKPVDRLASLMSSKSPEWYTPMHILDRVNQVLGAIDLDPCSNTFGPPRVPAARCFVEADNGLAQTWNGRVFLNPPYGDGIGEWVAKLLSHYLLGDVPAALALVPARVDTAWFRQLSGYPVCFVNGRLRFTGPDAVGDSAPFPSAIRYLGPDVAAFVRVFSPIGDVYRRMEP